MEIKIEPNVVYEDREEVFLVECINNDGLEHRLDEKSFYSVVDETAHYYYITDHHTDIVRAYSKSRFKKL